jgi:hypothetical protein
VDANSTTEIMRCIHIGLLCVQENVADRPTMASIVLMLSSYSMTLPESDQSKNSAILARLMILKCNTTTILHKVFCI